MTSLGQASHASRMGLAVAVVHALIWSFLAITTEPVPIADFADPIQWNDGAMHFDMCHDCEPLTVLAGRPFGLPWNEDGRSIEVLLLLNAPSLVPAAIVGWVLAGPLGQYGAMWVKTILFAGLSLVQWWAIGWLVGRRVLARGALASRHS